MQTHKYSQTFWLALKTDANALATDSSDNCFKISRPFSQPRHLSSDIQFIYPAKSGETHAHKSRQLLQLLIEWDSRARNFSQSPSKSIANGFWTIEEKYFITKYSTAGNQKHKAKAGTFGPFS